MKININKVTKIISIIILSTMLIFSVVPVFAATMGVDPTVIKPDTSGTTQVQTLGKRIVGIVSTIGTVISVLVLVVLGIKYMLGSPDEKAEYKKTMLPYVIGAVLVFAASTIAGVIYNFTNNNINNGMS